MLPDKHFYLLRHARSEANDRQIMSGGDCDSPLCKLGRDQAARVRDIIGHLPVRPDAVFHSPQARARETALIVNEALGLPMYPLESLKEIRCGKANGLTWKDAEHYFTNRTPFPGGESFDDFYARVAQALRHVFAQPGKVPMIVAHGGTFEAFARIFGVPINMEKVLNCHLHEFEPHGMAESRFYWHVWEHNPGENPARARATAFHTEIPDGGI